MYHDVVYTCLCINYLSRKDQFARNSFVECGIIQIKTMSYYISSIWLSYCRAEIGGCPLPHPQAPPGFSVCTCRKMGELKPGIQFHVTYTRVREPNSLTCSKRGDCHFLYISPAGPTLGTVNVQQ